MEGTRIIIILLVVMVGLIALARWIKVPYPILLVVAGLGIGFIPGLPEIQLAPDMVFILFLPPIIQLAAYYTPTRDFRANLRSISLLAIGLVLVTMAAVAVVAHTVIAGISWPAAFVLGAIVAPPDTVAASAVAERLHLPRRIVAVLEGESLLNDATSLVAYKVALAAVVTGAFSWLNAGGQFLLSSIGGVAIGLAVGFAITPIFRRVVKDIPVYIILTFLSGYVTYLLADWAQVSSVLAVVALGFFYAQPRFNTMTAELRLQAIPVWDIAVFLLNGFIFMLIGLQLHFIVNGLSGQATLTLLWYAVAVCLTVIIIRFAWIFPATYLPRLPKNIRARDPFPAWQQIVIVSWTGMRGVVSLAAALALPLTVNNTQPFPSRDLIIFLTFSVILATLVLQGLSLPFLVKWLKVVDDGGAEREENKARLKAAMAAQVRLSELAENSAVPPQLIEKLRLQYGKRIKRFSDRYHGNQDGEIEQHFITFEHLEEELLLAEADAVVNLRNANVINDEVLRRVQHELDLEIMRIRSVHGDHDHARLLKPEEKPADIAVPQAAPEPQRVGVAVQQERLNEKQPAPVFDEQADA